MLILTRAPGQLITLGDDIRVYMLGVHGRQVRLGIEAPRSLPVHRQEVYDRIRAGATVRPAAIGGSHHGR